MGTLLSVFGYVNVGTPPSTVVDTRPQYVVREYSSLVVATVRSTQRSAAFRILASYIGVFGKPQNVAPDAAADGDNARSAPPMTMAAPVLTASSAPPMAMTAPVLTESSAGAAATAEGPLTMTFVLPLQSLAEAPIPTNESVEIQLLPRREMAVRTFSGTVDNSMAQREEKALRDDLASDELWVPVDSGSATLARYNAPFTIPLLRKNEIMIEVERNRIRTPREGGGTPVVGSDRVAYAIPSSLMRALEWRLPQRALALLR